MSEAMTAISTPSSEPTLAAPPAEPTGRVPDAGVSPMFLARRSTRHFQDRPVPPGLLAGVLEAARWAPSSSNQQPWLFVYADTAESRKAFLEGVVEANRGWARHAPVLIYLFARRRIVGGPYDGLENPYARFDSGAAWMSLALQAELAGLSAHAMGGIHRDRMPAIAGVDPEEFDPITVLALGFPESLDRLPETDRAGERPSTRHPLRQVARAASPRRGPGLPGDGRP